MIILYIIGSIVLLLLLALIIPINSGIIISYNDNSLINEFYMKILFFKIDLSKKTKPKKKSGAKKSDEATKEKKTSQVSISRVIDEKDEILDILSFLAKRSITINNISIDACFGTGNAATTGVLTGAAYSGIYAALGTIHHQTKLVSHSVNLVPEFSKAILEILVKIEIKVIPILLIPIGIRIYKLLKKMKGC